MITKELIEHLKKFPLDAEVYYDGDGMLMPVEYIHVKKGYIKLGLGTLGLEGIPENSIIIG